MATTKKTTIKKDTSKKNTAPAEDKSVFDLMEKAFPVNETMVDTSVGQINVKDRIGFGDMTTLVNTIVEMCTNDETGEIQWESFDYISKIAICMSYCGIHAPKSIEVGYAAVCGKNGLFEQIKEYLDPSQLNSIFDSTLKKLRAREELNTSTAVGKLDKFLQSVGELMKMVEDASDGYSSEEAINALNHLAALTGGK